MKHILVTEDEFIISNSIKYYLEQSGYKVTTGYSEVKEILETVRHGNFDLILMKVKMKSSIDGIDIMHQIRSFSSIPVIYLTGDSGNSIKERIKQTQPATFLGKPFKFEELGKTIEKFLE